MYTQYTSDTNHPKHFQDTEGGVMKWVMNMFKTNKKTIREVTFKNKDKQPFCYPTFEIVDIDKWNTFLTTQIAINHDKSAGHVDDTYGWHNAYILDNNYRIDIKRNNEQQILHGGTVTFQHNDTVLAIAELKHNIEGFINAIENLIRNENLKILKSISNESTVEI